MAFVELTKEENPKLAVQVNNSLKYQSTNKDTGEIELKDRQKVTALTEIVKEAVKVSAMDKGSVMLSLATDKQDKNGKDIYHNYFVNYTQKGDIALRPMDENLRGDKNNFIYFKKNVDVNNPDHSYYMLSNSTTAAKDVVDNIKVNEVSTERGDSAYLGARVTLSNKELLQNMVGFEQQTNEKGIAIIGKDTLEIVTSSELEQRREAKAQERENQQQTKEAPSKDIPVEIQDKNGNVVEKTTTPKAPVQEAEKKTKNFKPSKEKATKTKEQDIER